MKKGLLKKALIVLAAALAVSTFSACQNMDFSNLNTDVMPQPSQELISEEKAKSIALKDAGLTEDQVTITKNKVITYQITDDKDQPVTNANGDTQYSTEYEVEFKSGNKEYEYSINALDGSVIEKNVDTIDDKADDDD